ncbi:hypothetical protein [Paenarthrobacter ureafaciens]|uniref:hypothetical protein n=1 Tax=Paenarthrobacter ureafaciens TaxID=37931 RepID=UPI0009AE983E|nr:hypothetical protein [Paenarthrobacter ureafaciens]
MKRNALRGFAAAGLLVMGLTACGGGGASTDVASSAPAGETPSATPTPTEAKQYTTQELVDLVKQIKADDGSELTVSAIDDLASQQNPLKELIGQMTIEPAECKELSTLGASQSIEGSTAAAGAKIDTDAQVVTGISLISGVDKEVLTKSLEDNEDQAAKCANMTMTMGGSTLKVSTEKFDGISSVPGAKGFKTAMVLPDGRSQSTYMGFAIKDGVLISATASGANAESEGVAAAGALMDQAAALIK